MKDLFGNESLPPIQKSKLRKAEAQYFQLVALYGKIENERCRNCVHFYRKSFAKSYPKCELASDTASRNTDWSGRWVACGKFKTKQA